MISDAFVGKCLLLLAPLLLLKGCTVMPAGAHDRPLPRTEARAQRESALQAVWRGRSYNSLVEAYGAPRLLLNVPGYRQLKTSVVVYDTDNSTRCIDAFTVVVLRDTDEIVVSDYFCR